MSQTTAILCHGDERKAGCGQTVALVNHGWVVRAGDGQILGYDRLGRARLLCVCGAVTMTRGQTAAKVG